jgi:hydroxyacylglutathione hydrolase
VKGLTLIDIRNPGEVEQGSITGARHISLPSLLKRIDEIAMSDPVVVFCAGGYRSSIAASLLKSHGFTDVSDLIGGYSAWRGVPA